MSDLTISRDASWAKRARHWAHERKLGRNWQFYLMLLLPVAWYFIFCYMPMYGILLGFKKYKASIGIWGSEWLGFKWFQEYFTSPYFFRTLYNTFILSFMSLLCGFPLPILLALMLKKSRLGRHFYAIGGNRQSALMLGCNVKLVRYHAYIISGLLAGIAGFINLMHKGAGNPTMAAGMEMDAIAASIIGGTMLSGGVGNVLGTLFGGLDLSTIKNIVQVSGISNGGKEWWQNITTGGMLCIFIVMQSIILFARGKRKNKKEAVSVIPLK